MSISKWFQQKSPSVLRIGLGLAALGRPGYINLGHADDLEHNYEKAAMEARTHEVLSEAYKLGVRYFDVARSYGLAEAFLASWLNKYKPLDVIIGSKWGYSYTAEWQIKADKHEIKEHSLENLNKQVQESQDLLGKQLKLYQIHSATLETGVLDNKAIHNRLYSLKQEGLKIGLSLSGSKQTDALEKALRIELNKERLFDSVQATFNVFEHSTAKTLERASKEGLIVIVKEALANGRLTNRNQDSEINPVSEEANMLGVTEDALALAWVLKHEWVDVVLSGASTVQQLKSNVTALSLSLNQETMEKLTKLEQSPEVYWQKRSSLVWN